MPTPIVKELLNGYRMNVMAMPIRADARIKSAYFANLHSIRTPFDHFILNIYYLLNFFDCSLIKMKFIQLSWFYCFSLKFAAIANKYASACPLSYLLFVTTIMCI